MTKIASRLAAYEDVLNAPEHHVAEILRGRLVTHPRPAPKHARASSRLGMVLGAPFDRGRNGPGGWIILDEPELHLGPEVVVPELAGWRRERMPKLPKTAWFETVPDWTCEVISPSSIHDDRVVKPGIYAEHGVAYYWLVEPKTRTLETFALRNGALETTATFKDGAMVAAPPFAEVPFSLDDLWMD